MKINAFRLGWKLFGLALTLTPLILAGCHSCGCGR